MVLNTIGHCSHTDTILQGLNELRAQELLVDITLFADERSFKAHRVVLASCSDYFRAMFTVAMSESHQSEICLKGVTALGIELLLNYAYTSKLDLTPANVHDVLAAASHVQMHAVVAACTDYLRTQLHTDNCVDLLNISETYSLAALRHECYRFVCANLHALAALGEIQRLAWPQLEHVLACDYPVDCAEHVVLSIVLQWLDDVMDSIDAAIGQRLLHHVRLADIPRDELKRTLDDALCKTAGKASAATVQLRQQIDALHLQLRSASPSAPLNTTDALVNRRGMEVALVNVGGFHERGITNDITYYLPSVRRWQKLTSIPYVEQCNYGTAVMDNELYVVGGCFNVSMRELILPYAFRFNPISNEWTSLQRMRKDRCRFSLNIVGGLLYAVGGVTDVEDESDSMDEDEHPYSNSECYDPVANRWSFICSIPESRSQHAGASYRGSLYITGGLDAQLVLASMWQFDVTEHGVWTRLADMPTARADHVMFVVNDTLIVCGGWNNDPDGEGRQLVATIDVYDAVKREWSVMTSVPTPKYHAGIVALDECIYIVGGFHSESMFDRATSTVECYDMRRNEWTVLDTYPQKIWEFNCVALYISKFRNDKEVEGFPEEIGAIEVV